VATILDLCDGANIIEIEPMQGREGDEFWGGAGGGGGGIEG
jgi:hypothetical protein